MINQLDIFVDEYTSPISATLSLMTTVGAAKEIFNERKYRHLPVIENDKPVGIISDRDICLLQNIEGHEKILIKDVMVEDPFCVILGTSIDDVVFEMSTRKIGSALVLDHKGNLDGIFTSIDALNALVEIVRGQI